MGIHFPVVGLVLAQMVSGPPDAQARPRPPLGRARLGPSGGIRTDRLSPKELKAWKKIVAIVMAESSKRPPPPPEALCPLGRGRHERSCRLRRDAQRQAPTQLHCGALRDHEGRPGGKGPRGDPHLEPARHRQGLDRRRREAGQRFPALRGAGSEAALRRGARARAGPRRVELRPTPSGHDSRSGCRAKRSSR